MLMLRNEDTDEWPCGIAASRTAATRLCATVARQQVGWASQCGLQQACQIAQAFVAGEVAVAIVELLELVHVDQQQ
jgi:hypothetical protein